MSMKDKIILAYSGGLDTSIILPWLKETYGYEVIAMIADVGQGDELTSVKEKAIKSGASKVYIEDLKEEFVNDFIIPTLKAGAIYENKYLLGTSFSRPLIAKRLVEIAKKEGADIVCHGCTGKGNDQVRLELTINALNPHLKIVAPWRIWDIKSRQDAIEYAKARNIPVPVTKKHPYSVDANIWHSSHEGGDLEDPWNEPQDNVYQACTPPWKAPNQAEYVEIHFDKGIPVKVNGEELDGVELLKTINKIGARHGVGIVDMVENRLVGIKSRGVYETPGGTILCSAHQHLESVTLDKSTFHYKQLIAIKFGELVYDGNWYTPLRKALSAFVDSTQENVSGRVRMKLYKGNCIPAGVQSPYSLYDEELATFEEDAVYDQKDAEGFIKIYGLPARINFLVEEKREG